MTYIQLFRKHIFLCFHDTLTQITCQVEAIQCFFSLNCLELNFLFVLPWPCASAAPGGFHLEKAFFGNKNKFMPIILDVKDYLDCSQVLLCPLFCLNFPSTRSNIKCFLEERQRAKIDPMQYDRPHDQRGIGKARVLGIFQLFSRNFSPFFNGSVIFNATKSAAVHWSL